MSADRRSGSARRQGNWQGRAPAADARRVPDRKIRFRRQTDRREKERREGPRERRQEQAWADGVAAVANHGARRKGLVDRRRAPEGHEPANAVERGVQEDLRERGLCGIIFDHEGVRSMCVREAPCELHAGGSPSEGTADRKLRIVQVALAREEERLRLLARDGMYSSKECVQFVAEADVLRDFARALNATAPRSTGEPETLDANEVMRLADQMAEARFCEGCEEWEGGSDRRAERAYTQYTEARARLFDLVASVTPVEETSADGE